MKNADAQAAQGVARALAQRTDQSAEGFGRGRVHRGANWLLRRTPALHPAALEFVALCVRAWDFARPICPLVHRDPHVVRIRRQAGPKSYLRLVWRWLRDTRLGRRDCNRDTWFRTYLPSR